MYLGISANEALDKVANVGLHINMISYLSLDYHYDPASVAIIMSLWNAVSHFMIIFGAFLSDSYLGRYRVISGAILFELLVSKIILFAFKIGKSIYN